MSTLEENLKEQVLISIQGDAELVRTVSEAIRQKERESLIDVVRRVAATMHEGTVFLAVIQSVVDWLIDIFS